MGNKLDLSALKNKAQPTDDSRSISLGATVKKTPVVHETTPNIPAQKKVETQSVKCECPVPTTQNSHNATVPTPTATPKAKSTAHQTQTIATLQKGSEEYLTAIQKHEAEKSQTTNVAAEIESEGKKTMISLTSIKSSHTDKKQIEEQVEPKKEDEFNSETETKIEKEIRVVAPAMKIASIAEVEKKEATIEAKNRDSGNDIQSDSLNGEVVLSPVDTKLVEKESKKLKNQIKNDLKNNDKKEKSEKKEVEVDNNMFENYKPKYGKKENVEKDVAGNAAPKFKKHLSAKKRNMIIAGLILFVLGISAGGYMFFNNGNGNTDYIQAIAVENNIAQTKENVENIINDENNKELEEGEGENIEEEAIIEDNNTEADGESEGENEGSTDKNIEAEEKNGEIAQAENSGDSKVKNYLLDNYYK